MDDLYVHLRYIDEHPHIGALFEAFLRGLSKDGDSQPSKQQPTNTKWQQIENKPGSFENFCSLFGSAGGTVT